MEKTNLFSLFANTFWKGTCTWIERESCF